jgi:hypothetical protein
MARKPRTTKTKGKAGVAKAKAHSPEHAAELEARKAAKAAERKAKAAEWRKAKAEASKEATQGKPPEKLPQHENAYPYSRELVDRILATCAVEEIGLRKSCEKHGLPYTVMCGWVSHDIDGITLRWMQVKRLRGFALVDEILDIADDTAADFVRTEEGLAFNREHVQRSKLRIETRQWLVKNILRDLFGDKVALIGGGEKDPPISAKVDLTALTDDQLRALETIGAPMAGAS